MDRAEAIRLLASSSRTIPEGEEYSAGFFQPTDGPGVARLFYAVYGDAYPIDTYYIPEHLSEEHRRGNIRSAVARTAAGDVVAHIALYRSSPPNRNLYEYGVGLTLPSYRPTMAFFRITQLIMEVLGKDGIDGFYGEAVCNHIVTQKLSRQAGALETAVEPALMPAAAYQMEKSAIGRVGCLVYSRVDVDCRKKMYIPSAYEKELHFILDGLKLDRELQTTDIILPPGCGEIDVHRFAYAGLARCVVTTPGEGLATQLAQLEQELRRDNYALIQFIIDLGKPWANSTTNQLRNQGFSLGGLLPIWFGDDGLLLQKHFVDPEFETMKILSDRGRTLLEMVKRDWQQHIA